MGAAIVASAVERQGLARTGLGYFWFSSPHRARIRNVGVAELVSQDLLDPREGFLD
jgi:hypothetical protein